MNDFMRFSRFLLLFIVLIFSCSARAETTNPKLFGLAMHGTPKYTPASPHLDYANPHAPKGGTLRIAGIGTFDTVNPFSLKGRAPEGMNLVNDRLMVRVWDEPFTLYPQIAESVSVPADRSSITFTLNPKAQFNDGSPITADDVIFTFETLRKEGRPNMRRTYALVTSVKKTGARGVTFQLGGDYNRETVMIIAMMPVLQKKWWQNRTFDSTLLTIPPTSGPYTIAALDPGRRITYQRDPNYWGRDLFTARGHFNADRIVYDYYRDDTIAMEAFKSGNLDLRREFDAGSWAQNYDFPAARDGRVQLFTIPHGRPERTKGFIFNTRRAPFDDLRVRKAFNLMFDADWVNTNLFHGKYKRINSYFPNSELAANNTPPPSMPRRAALREADRLLKEAGWAVSNGQRMKNGQPLSFEILLSAPEDKKISLSFTNVLEKMGIAPRIRVLDSANYIGRLNVYDFDMTLYYWTNSLSPGTEQILYWGCQAAQEHGRWNYPGICDPAIDTLAREIANAGDRAGLVKTVRALDQKLMDGVYMIPLFYGGSDYVAAWNPLRKPEASALYGMVLETWWLDPLSIQKAAQPGP